MENGKDFSANDEVKRSKEFQKNLNLKGFVNKTIKDLLVSETEKAFKEFGINKTDKPAGVYATGEEYGFGSSENKFNVKSQGRTLTSLNKEIVYGGKKLISDINCVFEGNTIFIQYKTTEDGNFRGIKDKNGQSYTFHKKYIIKDTNESDIKKILKKILFDISKKEVEYLLNTRLGVQDKEETGTASTVEENLKKDKMNKLTIKELFMDDEETPVISEEKKIKPNSDKIKKANTVDLNNGDKNQKMFLDDDQKEKNDSEEENIDEITSTAGGPGSAGPFRYDTPYFAKKNNKRPKVDRDYNVIPNKTEFYTPVELESGSGYVPKGMKQNFVQGLHNASKAQLKKMGYAENKEPKETINKNTVKPANLDLTRKKFFSLTENEQKGINKRYLITEKTTKEYEKERWSKLSGHKLYETIDNIDKTSDNNSHEDLEYDDIVVTQPALGKSGFEPSDEIEYFEKDLLNKSEEGLTEEYVSVEKPSSMFGTTYKFYKKDFLNESKKYILDLNTMTFVVNPNSI